MKKFFPLFIFIITTTSFAQITFEKAYGSDGDETANAVQQTFDGGYILAGSQKVGSASSDIYLVKTNGLGQVLSLPGLPNTRLTNYHLYQNYPNPFNPKTMIKYQLPMRSHVEMGIYNLLGQKVATLIDAKQPAGTYYLEWNGSGFASGIYLYRLSTDRGFFKTKKLILLK